jgi:beta-xylosidase
VKLPSYDARWGRFVSYLWTGLPSVATACFLQAQTQAATNTSQLASEFASLERNGKREAPYVHDPSTIVKCKDEYWFFTTGVGVTSWRSKDLLRWERGPRVFATPPIWVTNVVARQRGYFWAPDVTFQSGKLPLAKRI